MSSQIDPLMARIQTQILQATFLKNMACLKLHMPAVYQYYQNYQPKKVQLAFDHNGEVNLSMGNQFVYDADPKASSLAQVEKFLENPPCFDFEISLRDDENYQYQHEKVINSIYKKRRKALGVASPFYMPDGGQINFIAVIGLGLGYHIEHLLKQFSIRSIYIFEPEPDVFFAALHTVDMSVWFNSCISLGGELTFKIGGEESAFVNEIAQYFKREGYFLLPQMYLYRHYMRIL